MYELESKTKVVTFAGYQDGNLLKLRVRWRVETYDKYDHKETKYYKEDIRIPVPPREKDAAHRVVEYFTGRLVQYPGLYTQVISDDDPISLFGKDSF